MVALRRVWWVLVLGALATLGMACGGSSKTQTPRIGGGVSAGEGVAPTPTQAGGSSGAQQAGGAKPAQAPKGSPGQDGAVCKQCQSSNDAVKLSDADGYTFETGEAEAGHIQANPPAAGGEKPATFDAGRGMTGTTGSSNLRPH